MPDITPTDQDARELRRLRDKVDRGIKGGEGVSIDNTPTGVIIRVQQKKPSAPSDRPADVLVKITAAVGTGGQYDGTVYAGTLAAPGTGDLALPMGLTAGDSVLVLNADEDGQPTHWVELGTYAEGWYVGTSTEATPRPAVLVSRARYRTASPQALAAGTSETANADTWERAAATSGTDYGDVPLSAQMQVREVYNAAGDQVLYRYYRTFVWAADGRLHSASAETRVDVETPDTDCT